MLSLLQFIPVAYASRVRVAGTASCGGQRAKRQTRGEPSMEYAHFALHLLPTLAVVVLAWIIVRAVSVRVTWRRSDIRHLDDGTR